MGDEAETVLKDLPEYSRTDLLAEIDDPDFQPDITECVFQQTGVAVALRGLGRPNLWKLSYTFDTIGNMASRQDTNRGLTESFGYDNLNRLISSSVNGGNLKTISYDAYSPWGTTSGDGFFRLGPRDGYYGDDRHEATGRRLFRLHHTGGSSGCITACRATNWPRVDTFIRNTSQSNVSVNTYRMFAPGGIEIFRMRTGRESLTKYGTLTVE